jgi:hypothetical protein
MFAVVIQHGPSAAAFNQNQDRFTTTWSGPYDPDATDYAKMHPGLNYWHPNGTVNVDVLQHANRSSDREYQARHEADSDIDTGTSLVTGGRKGIPLLVSSWSTSPRGEKLER